MRSSCYRGSQASWTAGERRGPAELTHQKEKARRLPGTPESLFSIAPELTVIEPRSPPADADAVDVPPAAGTTAIEAVTSAITPTAIETTTAAAIEATATASKATAAKAPAASPATSQRGRSRPADQNGRGAGDVDEQQSQRCEAAGQDIVAFSHSGISGSLPRHLDFVTISLRRARQFSVQMH